MKQIPGPTTTAELIEQFYREVQEYSFWIRSLDYCELEILRTHIFKWLNQRQSVPGFIKKLQQSHETIYRHSVEFKITQIDDKVTFKEWKNNENSRVFVPLMHDFFLK